MAAVRTCLAEEEGFEPPLRFRKTVFKTAALNHSATPPWDVDYTYPRKGHNAARRYFAKLAADMLDRLTELCNIAAEHALDMHIAEQDGQQLIEQISLEDISGEESEGELYLRIRWQIHLGLDYSEQASMVMTPDHIEDEEALVLSMAAILLENINRLLREDDEEE